MPHGSQFRPHPIIAELAIRAELQGRSKKSLEDEDGVSAETWRSWYAGRRAPSLDRVAERAATLGCKIVLAPADPIPTQRDDEAA